MHQLQPDDEEVEKSEGDKAAAADLARRRRRAARRKAKKADMLLNTAARIAASQRLQDMARESEQDRANAAAAKVAEGAGEEWAWTANPLDGPVKGRSLLANLPGEKPKEFWE